jgi:hypothetical protein
MDTVGMFEKFTKLFIAMYPLHVNFIYPKHCFKNIPFSQAIRVKRTCSTVETTKQRLGDLLHHLGNYWVKGIDVCLWA